MPKKQDRRQTRTYLVHDTSKNRVHGFDLVKSLKMHDTQLTFAAPNIISLYLNHSESNTVKAQEIYVRRLMPIMGRETYDFGNALALKRLYDFYEYITTGIIFSYLAIEAFSNLCIPDDYQFKLSQRTGIEEIWSKAAIERKMSTSDKLTKVLPDIYKCKSPKTLEDWSHFQQLEDLRNGLVHLKSSSYSPRSSDGGILEKLLDPAIFEVIKVPVKIMSHFTTDSENYIFVPRGIEVKVKPTPISSFEEYFEAI